MPSRNVRVCCACVCVKSSRIACPTHSLVHSCNETWTVRNVIVSAQMHFIVVCFVFILLSLIRKCILRSETEQIEWCLRTGEFPFRSFVIIAYYPVAKHGNFPCFHAFGQMEIDAQFLLNCPFYYHLPCSARHFNFTE